MVAELLVGMSQCSGFSFSVEILECILYEAVSLTDD